MTSLEEEAMLTKTYMNKSCQSKIIVRNHDSRLLHYWLTMFYQPGGKAFIYISDNTLFDLFLVHIFVSNMKRRNVSNKYIRLLKPSISYWVNSVETSLEFINFVFQINIGIDNILLSFKSLLYARLCPFFNSLYFLCLLYFLVNFSRDLSVLLDFSP